MAIPWQRNGIYPTNTNNNKYDDIAIFISVNKATPWLKKIINNSQSVSIHVRQVKCVVSKYNVKVVG